MPSKTGQVNISTTILDLQLVITFATGLAHNSLKEKEIVESWIFCFVSKIVL